VTTLVTAFTFLGTATAAASTTDSAVSSGELSVQADTYSCFGYRGTFAEGTQVRYIDWNPGVEECFGVAPSGTIWHTWPGAGGWHEMPGNGRARGIFSLEDWEGSARTVVVYQYSSRWCQDWDGLSGWAGYWFDCSDIFGA
jgi:hypothetical protein